MRKIMRFFGYVSEREIGEIWGKYLKELKTLQSSCGQEHRMEAIFKIEAGLELWNRINYPTLPLIPGDEPMFKEIECKHTLRPWETKDKDNESLNSKVFNDIDVEIDGEPSNNIEKDEAYQSIVKRVERVEREEGNLPKKENEVWPRAKGEDIDAFIKSVATTPLPTASKLHKTFKKNNKLDVSFAFFRTRYYLIVNNQEQQNKTQGNGIR